MSSLCEGEREGLCHEISCCLNLDSPISLYFFFFLSLSCLFLTASVQVFYFLFLNFPWSCEHLST